MNSVLQAELTPFATNAIDRRAEERETTCFAEYAALHPPIWPDALSPDARALRFAARKPSPIPATNAISLGYTYVYGLQSASVTSLQAPESHAWLIWVSGDRGAEAPAAAVDDPLEGDRRLHALAAVERVQRLLALSQDGVAGLVGVSRPTLWNWQQGRTPQERSLRRLTEIAGCVDILVDATGGEGPLDAAMIQRRLGLDRSLLEVLGREDGPSTILDRLFHRSRASASAPSLLPTIEELLLGDDDDVSEAPTTAAPRPAGERRLK